MESIGYSVTGDDYIECAESIYDDAQNNDEDSTHLSSENELRDFLVETGSIPYEW